ncbi:hypothetical protein Chor_014881, partial [Crotalus horridus]
IATGFNSDQGIKQEFSVGGKSQPEDALGSELRRKMDRLKLPLFFLLLLLLLAGAALLTVLMPSTVFYLLLVCRTEQASVLSPPLPLPSLRSLWSPQDFALVLTWVAFQVLLYQLPMGKLSEGSVLRDKSRLQYRINGSHSMLVTALMVGAGLAGGLRLSYIYDHLLQLAFAATVVAFGLSVLLYLKALLAPDSALAPSGNSGNPIYDFFMGHELNPRIGVFDLKFFCELRPGLLGWVSIFVLAALINMAMLVKETELRGSPSLAMILVNAFQLLYVVDAFWHEVGFTHILPYFYIIYFTLLLAHRDARDEHQCLRKYGLAWHEYCRRVPYRIFPYLY